LSNLHYFMPERLGEGEPKPLAGATISPAAG